MNIELNLDVDLDKLVVALSRVPNKKLIKLFTDVDEMVCEYEFTETLAKIFQDIIDKENQIK